LKAESPFDFKYMSLEELSEFSIATKMVQIAKQDPMVVTQVVRKFLRTAGKQSLTAGQGIMSSDVEHMSEQAMELLA
jgi:hypothetical protein